MEERIKEIAPSGIGSSETNLQPVAERQQFLDFGDDAILLSQGWEGERRAGEVIRRHTFLARRASHSRNTAFDEMGTLQEKNYVVGIRQ